MDLTFAQRKPRPIRAWVVVHLLQHLLVRMLLEIFPDELSKFFRCDGVDVASFGPDRFPNQSLPLLFRCLLQEWRSAYPVHRLLLRRIATPICCFPSLNQWTSSAR